MAPRQAKCRGCGASILFVETIAKRWVPCDPKRVTIVTDAGQVAHGYESHFATCPKADKFRKKGKEG